MSTAQSRLTKTEVRRMVRQRIKEYLWALEGVALAEWVGQENVAQAFDEVQAIIKRVAP